MSVDKEYIKTPHGKVLKLYLYLQRGLGLVNEFHSVMLLGLAGFYVVHWWIIPLIPVSVLLLVIAGWYNVHRMSKMSELISIKHGSHYALTQFEIVKETRDILKDIKNLLEKNNAHR